MTLHAWWQYPIFTTRYSLNLCMHHQVQRSLSVNISTTNWILVKRSVHCVYCELNIADPLFNKSLKIPKYFTFSGWKNIQRKYLLFAMSAIFNYKQACKESVQQLNCRLMRIIPKKPWSVEGLKGLVGNWTCIT